MPDRDPILHRLQTISDGSAEVDLITPPIGRGEVWVLEEVSTCDVDTAGADVQLGIYDGNRFAWLRTRNLANADWYYHFHTKVTLLTDYQIVVRFLNTVDGDHLHVNVLGYVREPFTSP